MSRSGYPQSARSALSSSPSMQHRPEGTSHARGLPSGARSSLGEYGGSAVRTEISSAAMVKNKVIHKPRLFDAFCKGGGASVGYARAGFDVWGNDHVFNRAYPFTMVVADALELLQDKDFLNLFDVVAASPPCQENSITKNLRNAQGKQLKEGGADLIAPVRDALRAWGGLYVIENVPGAPLIDPMVLCGSMFGLGVRRHRLFESNVPLFAPSPCDHVAQGRPIGVYGSPNDDIPQGGRTARNLTEGREAMGINWMGWNDLKEAIPPAYTHAIGEMLMSAIEERAA